MKKVRRNGRRVIATLAVPMVIAAILTAVPSTAVAQTPITEPDHVRTIGGLGRADMYPSGLDVDADGNVYVADTGNDRIIKYPPNSNTMEWAVGQRGAPVSELGFSNPRDLAVDEDTVYVADMDNQTIEMLDFDGNFIGELDYPDKHGPIGISVGSDGAGNKRILIADGVTGNIEVLDGDGNPVLTILPRLGVNAGTRDAMTDSDGNIYVADYRHDAIQKYDENGDWLLQWGGAGAPTCQQIPRPYGVDVDDQDRIYVASSKVNVTKVYEPDGDCLGTFGERGMSEFKISQLRRVAVGSGPSPKVYNADLWGIKVLVYNQNGTLANPGRLGSWPRPNAGGLNEVHDVATTDSHVFAIDTINQRFQRFNLDGTNPGAWGMKGTGGEGARFNWPEGIGVNEVTQKVWIADTRNSRLVEFGYDGSGPLRYHGKLGKQNGQFNWPKGVTFDNDGNMYVVDTLNHRIQSFDVNLNFRWKYGIKGTQNDRLLKPYGITYHSSGRIFVADTFNSRIVVLDPDTGARLRILPIEEGSEPGQLFQPMGLAVAPNGALWVADTGNHRIQRFNMSGAFANEMLGGTMGSSNSQFNTPTGISVGPDGLVYVADTYNSRIQVVEPTTQATLPQYQGQIYNAAGVAPLYPAGGVSSTSGNRYLADSGGNRIVKIDSGGTQTPVTGEGLDNPRDVAIDSAEPSHLWVLDTGDNELAKIATDGTVITPSITAPSFLKAPFGLAEDASGLYVADTYNNRIVKINKTNGTEIWSATTCMGLTLGRPRDVAIGSDGKIYAADTDRHRIASFDATTGACSSAFGALGSGNGQFKQPRSLTSDGNGGLWVAEAGNFRIQHVTNAGAYIAHTGSRGTGPGQFTSPSCVFMDAGAVNVCDTFAFKLLRFTVNGAGVPSFAGVIGGTRPAPGGFNQPFGVAYGPAGEMYVTDLFNQRIQKFAPDGSFEREWGSFGSSPGSMQFPRGITVSPDGQTVVLTNSENNRIDLFTPTGGFIKSIKPAGQVMGWPHQTAMATDGSLWIADTNKNRVLHVAQDGTVLHNWNGGGTVKAPRGIALDAAGDVYVSNSGANRVDKYSQSGTLLSTLATVGTGAKNVRQPWNLAIVGTGAAQRLYITDGTNNRIVIMDLAGNTVGLLGASGNGDGEFNSPRSVAVNPVNGTIAVADFLNNRISLWSK